MNVALSNPKSGARVDAPTHRLLRQAPNAGLPFITTRLNSDTIMAANLLQLDTNNFKDTVDKSATPVLVDFWAPWCGPCKAIAPILEELATELNGKLAIAKVNVDDNAELAAQFGVRAIPTLLLFKGGQLADQYVGMMDKASLKAKLAAKL